MLDHPDPLGNLSLTSLDSSDVYPDQYEETPPPTPHPERKSTIAPHTKQWFKTKNIQTNGTKQNKRKKKKQGQKWRRLAYSGNVLNVFWSHSQTLLPKTECLGQITVPINASGRISSETSGLFLCSSSTAVSWWKQVNNNRNTNKKKH